MQMADGVGEGGGLGGGNLFADASQAIEPRWAQFVRTGGLGGGGHDHHLFRARGGGLFEQSSKRGRPIDQAMRFTAPVGIGRKLAPAAHR